MPKIAPLIIAAAALALLASPAMAKHAASCYDYAWESQDQKDCLAHPESMKHHHPMHQAADHQPMHHKHKGHGKIMEKETDKGMDKH
jgi:hypothetical protein